MEELFGWLPVLFNKRIQRNHGFFLLSEKNVVTNVGDDLCGENQASADVGRWKSFLLLLLLLIAITLLLNSAKEFRLRFGRIFFLPNVK